MTKKKSVNNKCHKPTATSRRKVKELSRDLTQEEVARRMGFSVETLVKYYNDEYFSAKEDDVIEAKMYLRQNMRDNENKKVQQAAIAFMLTHYDKSRVTYVPTVADDRVEDIEHQSKIDYSALDKSLHLTKEAIKQKILDSMKGDSSDEDDEDDD